MDRQETEADVSLAASGQSRSMLLENSEHLLSCLPLGRGQPLETAEKNTPRHWHSEKGFLAYSHLWKGHYCSIISVLP